MTVLTSAGSRRGWPPELESDAQGLRFDGCDVRELAERYGTPLWVFSRTTLVDNFARFRDAFRSCYPGADVAFSMKAQNTLAVVRVLHSAGARMDCTGENELHLALQCGVPPEDIILNVLPLSFDYGLYQAIMTFRIGGTLILEKSFTYPHAILELLVREKVTGFPLVPTMAAIPGTDQAKTFPLTAEGTGNSRIMQRAATVNARLQQGVVLAAGGDTQTFADIPVPVLNDALLDLVKRGVTIANPNMGG
jgi:hypothetical protein